jgi:hypothetical protein
MQIPQPDFDTLQQLEESLWRSETRFDPEYMNHVLSPDFFEFGRSGRVYRRDEIMAMSAGEIDATLKNFTVHLIDTNVALVTYISEVKSDQIEIVNRSSLWTRTNGRWQIRFHQGTPVANK